MRLLLVTGALIAASPAVAIEPAMLPRDVENSSRSVFPPPAEIESTNVVADGVPVEAVIGGAEAPWIAGADGENAALRGLDPVSFFEPGGPTPGIPAFKAEYHGSVFYFADKAHRDLFLSAPEAFAPAFGGYDPELLAVGSLLPADPENWTVYDGRLFLSGSPKLKSDFDRHKPEVIKAAQEKWKAVDAMFQDRFFKAHQD